jgi:glycosyltransferase involved in cell wall biosynthesis
MRIGINTLFLVPGDVGGTEIFLRNTLQAMAQNFPDFPLVLFTSLDNDTLLRNELGTYPQIEFKQLGFKAALRPMRIMAEQSLLPVAVKNAKIDVLWSPGYTAPALCSCPQVVTVPDLQYKSHPDDMSFFERKVLDVLVKIACRRCSFIITISKFSRQEVVRYNFAPYQKITSIYLGVEKSFALEVKKEAVADSIISSLPPDKPYILCVAHSYPHKNIHVLVQAYARIQDYIPHDLVLVGKARRGEGLVDHSLTQVNDKSRVHRLSGLDFPSVKYVFQKADLFVLPSAYEGFGLPVLEAMMSGTLVVTTNKASIPEVGGDCVLYCNPLNEENLAKVIFEALNIEKDKKRGLLRQASSRAAIFTWEKTAQETIGVLQAATAGNRIT